MTRLNVGDWVKFFPSDNGHYARNLIHVQIKGFIEDIDGKHADVRGYTGGIMGKLYISQKVSDLEPCRDAPEYTQESLRTMINIALDTKDRNWFEELTSELKRIQEVEG